MAFQDLFIVARRAPAEKGAAVAAAAAGSSEGVFLSAKSILSFPVASELVTILWKLWKHFDPGLGDVAVLYISLVIGALIFLIVISEPAARPQSFIGWVVSIVIAALNSCFLAASALGLAKEIL